MSTTTSVTIQVKHTIDRQRLEDLLVTAFEGGSNYWIARAEPLRSGRRDLYEAAFDGGVNIYISAERGDPRSGEKYRLNLSNMERGLQVMADKHPRHMADILAGNDDATTGDVFLQLCLFGDVVYG